jgi:outer membrane receptor for ferrienterochelin and colicins
MTKFLQLFLVSYFFLLPAAHSENSAISQNAAMLETITVYGNNLRKSGMIKDEIAKTEVITAKDIEKINAKNLNEAVDNHPGIAVQTECSICNVRNIVLNNMPGRFTTLTIDGIPIFSSVSTAYGIDSINVKGVESIEVARGAGASLNAPEALSGTVNIVTKRPAKNAVEIKGDLATYNGNKDNNLAKNASIYLENVFKSGASNLSFLHQQHDSVDTTGAKISQFTGYDRDIFGSGYFLDDIAGFKIKGRVDIVSEDRGGGALGNDYDAIKSDISGNPFDFSQLQNGSQFVNGWNNPDGSGFTTYDGGTASMSEIIFTDRVQLIDSATRQTDFGKLKLAGGYAHHKQNSFYEGTVYNARQDQFYAHASNEFAWGKNIITGGTDYRYQDLSSSGYNSAGNINNGIDNYRYEVYGLFGQFYRAFFHEKMETNLSARFDHHNIFGNIFIPRANLLYHHNNQFSSRFSAGLGYRAPTSFFEQEHGILDTTKIVRQIKDPEKSQNVSYSLNYSNDRFESVLTYNYNKIDNFAMLDSSYNDGTETLFTSAKSPVIIQGFDLNSSYKITPAVSVSLGAERFFYRFQPGTLLFSRPEEKVYFGLDYEKAKLELFTKINWVGSQNLAKFYNYENDQRYNLDGSEKMRRSPSFFTLDLGGSYDISRSLQFYGGIENFFNYLQSNKDSQLWIDAAGNIDVTQIWGPFKGRHIFIGLKMTY